MSTRPWWRRRTDADFHDEIRAHLDLEAERLIADGVNPVDARERARRAFGNVTAAEERFYEASRWVWVEQLRQDTRYAVRTLWHSRTFVASTLVEIREVLLYPLRVASWIGSLLGIVALTLSVSGLYGLLTYVLGQRTREIGIRMALGASARGVVQLIMRQSARVVGIGMAVGLVFTYSALTLLDATLPLRAGNVSIFDGWSFVSGVALVAVAGAIASYFPARRAARVDPCSTLRADG